MKKITSIIPPRVVCLLFVMSCQAVGSDVTRGRMTNRMLINVKAHQRGAIPPTVSDEAKEIYARLWMEGGHSLMVPAAEDTMSMRRMRDSMLLTKKRMTEHDIGRSEVTLIDTLMGGARVMDVRPKGWRDDGRSVILFHGGAFNPDDAFTASAYAAPLAKASGMRVIVVDNTPAPRYNWKEIQRESMNVLLFLKHKGYRMEDLAVCGVGPGGGLATSVVLNMRNHGFGMPGAVVLWSPWADLSEGSDSRHSLAEWDPVTPRDASLRNTIGAYAAGLGLEDARVSPARSDFRRGFPPTLIQDGTRSSMLSGGLMLYRSLDSTGLSVKLDLYEGMFPGFQRYEMEEAERAVEQSASFIRDLLHPRKG